MSERARRCNRGQIPQNGHCSVTEREGAEGE